jgi:fatty-acyl-CoA synthase
MVIGGAPLPASLAQAAGRAGITTVAGYGMSESGPVISISRSPTGDPGELRHAGQPLPLVQALIDGEAGRSGELVLRAPWLTQEYGGEPAATADLWSGGWMHTQDVARIRSDGTVEILDRLKDVIKTGGEWVSSPLMEELAMMHSGVAAAAFVGIPDDRWGERPVAFIVPADTATFRSEALLEHLMGFAVQGRISRYALPDRIITLEALPLTSVGKVDKKTLRASIATTAVRVL